MLLPVVRLRVPMVRAPQVERMQLPGKKPPAEKKPKEWPCRLSVSIPRLGSRLPSPHCPLRHRSLVEAALVQLMQVPKSLLEPQEPKRLLEPLKPEVPSSPERLSQARRHQSS